MKVVKLKKRYLKDLDYMYVDLGVVDTTADGGRSVNPSSVFMSEKDMKALKSELVKSYKKKYPYAPKKQIDMAVGMYMLNLAPNSALEKVLKPGYLVIV